MQVTYGSLCYIPAEAKDISSSLCAQTSSEANPASCLVGTEGPFQGGKAWSGRDAENSPHLLPRTRMSMSYTPRPFCACMAVVGSFIFLLHLLLAHTFHSLRGAKRLLRKGSPSAIIGVSIRNWCNTVKNIVILHSSLIPSFLTNGFIALKYSALGFLNLFKKITTFFNL
jgi:hypothetical protein